MNVSKQRTNGEIACSPKFEGSAREDPNAVYDGASLLKPFSIIVTAQCSEPTALSRMTATLERRSREGLLRCLRTPQGVDFSSNDYLGLSRNSSFRAAVASEISVYNGYGAGATGSRLLSGHSALAESIEDCACVFHNAEAALLFNSGYEANLSLLSCVPGVKDAIVYDALVHASIHDGMRAGRVPSFARCSFAHNSVDDMRKAILKAQSLVAGSVIVCIETVYSMDGDVAPLREMLGTISELHHVTGREILLVADEAHAGGLYGIRGQGLAYMQGVARNKALLARVVTFGKAFGAHGAIVLCSKVMKEYLINYARPLIYSTALPPHSLCAIRAAYKFMETEDAVNARRSVWLLRDRFREMAEENLHEGALLGKSLGSPIQGVLVPGNDQCVAVAKRVFAAGFDVRPIRSPTVPRGQERIRVVIHAHNTLEEINGLVQALAEALKAEEATQFRRSAL